MSTQRRELSPCLLYPLWMAANSWPRLARKSKLLWVPNLSSSKVSMCKMRLEKIMSWSTHLTSHTIFSMQTDPIAPLVPSRVILFDEVLMIQEMLKLNEFSDHYLWLFLLNKVFLIKRKSIGLSQLRNKTKFRKTKNGLLFNFQVILKIRWNLLSVSVW